MNQHLRTWSTYWIGTNTGNYNGWFDAYGQIRVYLTGQSTSGNYSTIRIDHYIIMRTVESFYGMSAQNIISSYRANNGSYGGTYQTASNSYGFNHYSDNEGTYLIGSTNHTVYHNSDGSAKLYVQGSLSAELEELYDYNSITATRTSSFNIDLPSIARHANINSYTLSNSTLNSVRVNWSASSTVDRVEYRRRVGSGSWTSWTLGQGGDRTSGNFNVVDLNPNTNYTVQIRVRRKSNQLWTNSSNLSRSTLDIAKFVNVPNNINVDNPFTVTFNRNGASTVELAIYNTAGSTAYVAYRVVSGSSYTFNLTTSEKNALFGDMSTVNSKQYRIYIATNSNSYRDYTTRNFVVSNANPTFSNFTYQDTNTTTVALTGNNQTIIKGYSNLKTTISTANRAIANKGATMKEYQLVVGAKQVKANYSSSSSVNLNINAIDNNVFIVYAIDSRSNSTPVQKSPATYIDYFKPVISNANAIRTGGIGEETTLSFNGSFFNGSFGAENNKIQAQYSFKRTSSTEASWQTFPGIDNYKGSSEANYIYKFSADGHKYTDYFTTGDEVRIDAKTYRVVEISDYSMYLDANLPNEPGANVGTIQYMSLWTFGGELELITNGNNFSFNGVVRGDLGANGFDSQFSYNFIITVSDELSMYVEDNLILGTGVPNIAMHQDGTAFNMPYDDTQEPGVQLPENILYMSPDGELRPLIVWVEED